jgi:hypothetical protein
VTQKKATRKKRKVYTRKNSDKHDLYQLSVQDAEVEVGFVGRTFKKLRGRDASSLREDFCGTALFAGAWVKSRRDRSALGIDIDQSVLDWGIEHNLKPIREPGQRLTLSCSDVRAKVNGKFDICCAFNFSYWCFMDRVTMRGYFEGVRKSLVKDGLFFLDAYGGYESHQPDLEEPRKIEQGFTYIWNQDKVDPINNTVLNHIHFKFKDGSQWRKAFSYEWRSWSLRELDELLREAGFRDVQVYWEGADKNGEGNGVYRPQKVVDNEASWVAYIVASV